MVIFSSSFLPPIVSEIAWLISAKLANWIRNFHAPSLKNLLAKKRQNFGLFGTILFVSVLISYTVLLLSCSRVNTKKCK